MTIPMRRSSTNTKRNTHAHTNRQWYWLEEDPLAVLSCLTVCRPRLQGHPLWVQTLWAKQLTDVRRQHDVHTAVGAQVLPSHTQTERLFDITHKHLISKIRPRCTLLRSNVLNTIPPPLLRTLLATCRWGQGCWRSSPCVYGAAGSDLLSRTSPSWPSRSSPCEGSPQSPSPVHPHLSF